VIEPRYLKYAHKLAPQAPQPEKRLELCIISGWTLVVAMFWFGWTSYPSIHWISPVLAGGLIGFSVLGMFVSLYVGHLLAFMRTMTERQVQLCDRYIPLVCGFCTCWYEYVFYFPFPALIGADETAVMRSAFGAGFPLFASQM
jgi:hypothetical protein